MDYSYSRNCLILNLTVMAIFGVTTRYIYFAVPLSGFFIGKFLDDQETLRMTNFRDKSCLYGENVKMGETPTWP